MSEQASDLKTKIRHQWCRLSEDELEQVHTNAHLLAGKLQEHYGWAREEAERQVKDFSRRHGWAAKDPQRERARPAR